MYKKLLVLGAIALAMGATARLLSPPVVAGSAHFGALPLWSPTGSETGRQGWEPVWTAPATLLADVALAPDGSSVAWVDRYGAVRRLHGENGATLWQTPAYSGMDRVRVSRQGMVLVYSSDDTRRSSLRLLDPERGGERSSLVPVRGTIRAAEVTPDGNAAVIAAEPACLYTIPMRCDAAWPGMPRELPDVPVSLDFHTDAQGQAVAFCGTRQGRTLAWRISSEPDSVPEALWQDTETTLETGSENIALVDAAENGDLTVTITGTGAQRSRPVLTVREASTGRRLWSNRLEGFAPKASVSANGRFIAVTYSRQVSNTSVVERKIALFDRKGERLFSERGGISFVPELAALSPDGNYLTVRDKDSNLWLLDNRGRTLSRLRPPRDTTSQPLTLKEIRSTPDGTFILLHFTGKNSEDRLTLYRYRSGDTPR